MASSQAAESADETDASTFVGGRISNADAVMEELRRVQIANEGMNLLLCSRLKEAEEIFKKSRSVEHIRWQGGMEDGSCY